METKQIKTPKNIIQKIGNIQQEANFVDKSAVGFKFKYQKESQILEFVKAKFKKYNLTYAFSIVDYEIKSAINKNTAEDKVNENTINFIMINIELTIYNNDIKDDKLVINDYFIVDINNKMAMSQALGSAKTYGIRYAFSKLFGIADDDIDPDALLNKELELCAKKAKQIKVKIKDTKLQDEFKLFKSSYPELMVEIKAEYEKQDIKNLTELMKIANKIKAMHDFGNGDHK